MIVEYGLLRSLNWRKARKAYTCSQCGRNIEARDRYLSLVAIVHSHYERQCLCVACGSRMLWPNPIDDEGENGDGGEDDEEDGSAI